MLQRTRERAANLCCGECCVWTAAQPGGSAERRPPAWTSPRPDFARSAQDRPPSCEEEPPGRSVEAGASCSPESRPLRTSRDGRSAAGGRGRPGGLRGVWGCRCGGACVCVGVEGRGWGSLGTGVRWSEAAEELKVLMGLIETHRSEEQLDFDTTLEDCIWLCPTSRSSSG